jgi:hypothetical protein
MTLTGTAGSEMLRSAYRTTFQDYSNKLNALQQLMAGRGADSTRVEAALLEVEKARVAHNCARDRLARELVRPPAPPDDRGREEHIRETARLLWELSGRPEGTAERDWRKAEQLVHEAAAAVAC